MHRKASYSVLCMELCSYTDRLLQALVYSKTGFVIFHAETELFIIALQWQHGIIYVATVGTE